jgi:hypothetical protein
MGIVSRADTVTTVRQTIYGTRAELRAAVVDLGAAGVLVTYTEPVPTGQLGRFAVDVVVMTPDRQPSTDVVPLRAVIVVDPVDVPAPAGRRRGRRRPRPVIVESESVRYRRTRAAYRRVRAVKRSTVVRTAKVTAVAAAGTAAAWLVYEVVLAVIAVLAWIAANLAAIIGGTVFVALVIGAVAKARCSVCGK